METSKWGWRIERTMFAIVVILLCILVISALDNYKLSMTSTTPLQRKGPFVIEGSDLVFSKTLFFNETYPRFIGCQKEGYYCLLSFIKIISENTIVVKCWCWHG